MHNKMEEIYRFAPILKETIWGGHRIAALKHLTSAMGNIGESWELSGVMGHESVVAEGACKGLAMSQLIAEHREQLVGRACYGQYGNEFPLLIKLIDARDDLSIQVHPDDATARRHGYGRGKTEMWYALDSAPDARLYNGLQQVLTPQQFAQMVERKTITSALAQYPVSEGDVFFIPAGRVHAIGRGCFVAEIQQTSDVTYRIYDFDRRDQNGQPRQLHIRQAADSIDYSVRPDYRTHYTASPNQRVTVVRCPYFTTSVIDVQGGMSLDYRPIDSFVVLMATRGSALVSCPQGTRTRISAGQTVLLPATTTVVQLEGNACLLESLPFDCCPFRHLPPVE